MKSKPEHERQDWGLVLIILLIGFVFVIIAGQWALRFSPSWTLDTNMDSHINPNSDFLTHKPQEFFEPVDQAILTQPAWLGVFLTPDASITLAQVTRTPLPAVTDTVPAEATLPVATNTLAFTSTAVPTNTLIWNPLPATSTPKPKNTSVPTSVPTADLQVTNDDGVAVYVPGRTLTYTIIVSNSGPNNVTGATVTDTFPTQITGASWTCNPAGGASCTAVGSGNINDLVNLPVGSSVTYTVTVNVAAGAAGNLVNTATVSLPTGYTESNSANNTASDTDTPQPTAELKIEKTDNVATYAAGGTVDYKIIVSNSGPSNVTGATVTDTFPLQISLTGTTWTCGSMSGGSCTAGGTGNISDSSVNLPVGSSVTYNVHASINTVGVSGDLINIAYVSRPIGFSEVDLNDNSATDSDAIINEPGQGGPNGNATTLGNGATVTFNLSGFQLDGNSTWDVVYYEMEETSAAGKIHLGAVRIDVYNQTKDAWYTIYYWGNDIADTNASYNRSPEPDGFPVDKVTDALYGVPPLNTGIAIDVDTPALAQGGAIGDSITVIRITSLSNGKCDVDALQRLR